MSFQRWPIGTQLTAFIVQTILNDANTGVQHESGDPVRPADASFPACEMILPSLKNELQVFSTAVLLYSEATSPSY